MAAPHEEPPPSTANAMAIVDAGDDEVGWPDEPQTLADLESKYEVVISCPGRFPTTLLKVVKATPKDGGDPTNVSPGQDYKLFLVRASET